MNKEKTFSVSQLSKLTGVSVRTLHHYDSIGLLKPNRCSDNGYRQYYSSHIALLQQIIIYRELDFSLKDILNIVTSKDFDLLAALQEQRNLLLIRQQQNQSIINNIEVTMNTLAGKNNLDIFFKGLPTEKVERWNNMIFDGKEAEESNDIFSALGQLSTAEATFEQSQFEQWVDDYLPFISYPINSKEIQPLIKDHYIMLNRFIKKLSQDDDFKGIGYNGYLLFSDKVLTDPVSVEMYEHYHLGMAEHLHEAMMFFAEHSLKENVEEFRTLGIS